MQRMSGERETMLGALQILFIRANLVLQAIDGRAGDAGGGAAAERDQCGADRGDGG